MWWAKGKVFPCKDLPFVLRRLALYQKGGHRVNGGVCGLSPSAGANFPCVEGPELPQADDREQHKVGEQ